MEYQVVRRRFHKGCGGTVDYRCKGYFCQKCGKDIEPAEVLRWEGVEMIIEVGWPGFTEIQEWEEVTIHCPRCGVSPVWVGDEDDFYVGKRHICLSCSAEFYMPGGVGEANKRFLEPLMAAKAAMGGGE